MRTTNPLAVFAMVAIFVAFPGPPASAQFGLPNALDKLDPLLRPRTSQSGRSRVIVSAAGAGSLAMLTPVVQLAGGVVGRSLPIINGVAADLPNAALSLLAGNPLIAHIAMDRVAAGALER